MTNFEFKSIEGQRLQQVLGAIGALPAAMLVFGGEPTHAAPGAPLFALAIFLCVAAIMAVNYTDSCFYLDQTMFDLPEGFQEEWENIQRDTESFGVGVKDFSLLYGCASLIASLIGVSAVYSEQMRLPVPVWVGFLVTLLLALIICLHVVGMSRGIHALLLRYRAISVHCVS